LLSISTLLDNKRSQPKRQRRQHRQSRFRRTPSSPLGTVIVPQGLVQIADTLTKSEAAWVDTHIGAGQPLLRQSGLSGALGATRREQCGKEANQDDS